MGEPVDALHDPLNLGVIAAICGGCGMLVLLIMLFLTVAFIHKTSSKRQIVKSKNDQASKTAEASLYTSPNTQSTLGLMSQMSSHSFASSPSEIFNSGNVTLPQKTIQSEIHHGVHDNVQVVDNNKGILFIKGVDNRGFDGPNDKISELVDERFEPIRFRKNEQNESTT